MQYYTDRKYEHYRSGNLIYSYIDQKYEHYGSDNLMYYYLVLIIWLFTGCYI